MLLFRPVPVKYSTVVLQAERAEVGVYDTTLRLSVGIEDGCPGGLAVFLVSDKQ